MDPRRPWRIALRGLLDLLSPDRCRLCGAAATDEGAAISPGHGLHEWHRTGLCRACATRLGDAEPIRCHLDAEDLPAYGGCRTDADLARLVGELKYHGLRGLARPLAESVGRALARARDDGVACDILVPVPLHPARRRRRGFNQARLLAEVVGAHAGLPVGRLLKRTRNTAQQAKIASTDREDRRRNVRRVFAAATPPDEPPRLALVDDLITTGATVGGAAAALRDAGWPVGCALAAGLALDEAGDLDSPET